MFHFQDHRRLPHYDLLGRKQEIKQKEEKS